jgi:hypothetical protein
MYHTRSESRWLPKKGRASRLLHVYEIDSSHSHRSRRERHTATRVVPYRRKNQDQLQRAPTAPMITSSYIALEILNQLSMLNIPIGNSWGTDPESKVKLATFQTYGTSYDIQSQKSKLSQLANTITEEELLTLAHKQLLTRLFHEEGVRIFEPLEGLILVVAAQKKHLGQNDAEVLLEEQGIILVSCEFCGFEYRYDATDIDELFGPNITH